MQQRKVMKGCGDGGKWGNGKEGEMARRGNSNVGEVARRNCVYEFDVFPSTKNRRCP